MKISVRVKTGARENSVKKIDENSFAVSVKARPIEGKANEAVIAVLAEYFDVSKSRIDIVSGHTSKIKCFEIL